MEEKAKLVIRKKLEELGEEKPKKAHLEQMKAEVVRVTGNKFLSMKTLEKWVRDVKKEMKSDKKKATLQKKEPEVPVQVSDRVFLQTISYEIASIRRMMDRISKQLDDMERMLGQ
ncbi:MAG: hypothetical protein NT157_06900 [Candidatus Micrarchaeota archaeon]|nr:hypothetical protein [Candidatus Micrarchaeota archaeon]